MAYSPELDLLLTYAFPAFAVLILAELALLIRRRRANYDLKDVFCSLIIAAGNRFVRPFTLILLSPLFFLAYEYRVWTVPMDQWWGLVLLFLGVELAYYWLHRHSHAFGWMWATHHVHHSAKQVAFSTAVRLGWTDLISLTWVYWFPLFFLGFHPAAVFLCYGIGLIYQFLLHTELVPRLWGPVEWLLNTPSNHRVHHASDPIYHDRNFGNVLMVYDHLFGTYAKENREVLDGRYGVAGASGSTNPITVLFEGWVELGRESFRKTNWQARLNRVLVRPEYVKAGIRPQDR